MSPNAYVAWTAGPNHTLTYTRPNVSTDSAIITDHLQFSILALAWWENNSAAYNESFQALSCLTMKMRCFEVLATVVDIGFSFPPFTDTSVPFELISGLAKLFAQFESCMKLGECIMRTNSMLLKPCHIPLKNVML